MLLSCIIDESGCKNNRAKGVNMKKLITILSFILCACIFSSCGAGGDNGGINNNYKPPMGNYDNYYPEGATPEQDADNPYGDYEYDSIVENGFVTTAVKATSTFSLDRNTASYTLARKQLTSGFKVPKDSVRIEEFINYFSYNYEKPQEGEALAVSGSLSNCPWNESTKLFTVNVSAEEIKFENRTPNNLVFLIDTSGSMYGEERLGLIQNAFTMLTENLADIDTVSIVTYASGVRVACEGVKGSEKSRIANVLQDLTAGGSTNGAGGIQLAYSVAEKYFVQGGNNRVMLATDGDFNVGISDKNSLNEFISAKRESGIYLSVFGVGLYNTSDTTMKTLAENGNGNYGYIDNINEARKLLVNEMGGTLVTVAKDAKIQVTFNADMVKQHRLIGYESKMLTDDEFNDNNTDAGEIGSGHTVTAVYELIVDEVAMLDHASMGHVEVRYKTPDSQENKSVIWTFFPELLSLEPTEDVIFAGCVTEFGLLLRESGYKANASFEAILQRLNGLASVSGLGANEFRAEFKKLVEMAKLIYA